jgi:hypothetical protein
MSKIDYLKREIKKTGYPLEIEISSQLDKVWEYVVNTDSYFDKDEKKLRDIDIFAFDSIGSQKTFPIILRVGLVIECKKDEDSAWVFFTRPYKYDGEVEGQYVDEVQSVTKNTECTEVMDKILPKVSLHYKSSSRTAIAYDTFCFNTTKRSFSTKKREIFEAQNQITKYVGHTIEQSIMERARYYHVYPIQFFFPCIILDGLMYDAIVDNGSLTLKESDHVVLSSQYRSPYSIYENRVLIDVVRKSYFREYQKLIRQDVESFKRVVKRQAGKLSNEIEKVISLVGSTRKTD